MISSMIGRLLLLIHISLAFGYTQKTASFRNHASQRMQSRDSMSMCIESDTSTVVPEDRCNAKRKELLDTIDLYNMNKKKLENTTEIKKPQGFFGAETRGAQMIAINPEEKKIIDMIENFALFNPTSVPLQGFLGYKENTSTPVEYTGAPIDRNVPTLGGTWKLRFTTATDATFKTGKRGPVTTLQYVNTTVGTFTNIIEFKENPGKTKSVQVVVDGRPVNDTRINLTFRRVIFNRRSRVGLNQITIPIPSFSFLKRFQKKEDPNDQNKKTGPYFNMIYLDDEMRIHKTGDNNYFVQTRLYDAWDPMKGWTLISAV